MIPARERVLGLYLQLADAQASEAVQPRNGAFDGPAEGARAGAVWQARVRRSPGGCLARAEVGGTCRGRSRGPRRAFRAVDGVARRSRPRPGSCRARAAVGWCLPPGRARSTGLGPLLGPGVRPGRGTSRSPPSTSRVGSSTAASSAGARAAGPRRRPRSRPPDAARRRQQVTPEPRASKRQSALSSTLTSRPSGERNCHPVLLEPQRERSHPGVPRRRWIALRR
jgi:hypothetical protein